MRYAPCIHCGSIIAFEHNQPLCGSCMILIADQERAGMDEGFLRSMREENEYWGSDADLAEADQFEEEVRQQMEEDDQMLYTDRLRSNASDVFFRRVYTDHDENDLEEDEDEEDRRNEEELYENDQDDFDFDMSYDDNIQAIRDGLSTRRFELELDRSAIVQRLLRIFAVDDSDASQANGATESDIAILKTRTLNIDDPEKITECAICTENFEKLELTQLPCKHEYHSECIHHWLKLNASCPMCRQSISKSTLIAEHVQEEEPDIIIMRRETAALMHQNNSPSSFMDDVD